MKKLNPDIQNFVLTLLQAGHTVERVAEQSSVSVGTVSRLRNKFLPDLPRQAVGRPQIISSRTVHVITRMMVSGQLKTPKEVLHYLQQQGVQATYRTVVNTLRKNGFKARRKQKKPFLSDKHKRVRYRWAKAYAHWTAEDWRSVVFSDETKINIWNSDGIHWYWSRDGDRIQPEPTVKHGGRSLMFWGCVAWRGQGYGCKVYDGNMTKDDYVHILGTTLQDSLEYYGYQPGDVIFQHDNDPKHTAKLTQTYLEDNGIETLPWPAQSPDLNMIEHIWHYLKVRIGKREKRPTSVDNLWEIVQEEWDKIPLDYIHKLYESMPSRVQAVLKAKGGYTKY